MKGENISNMHKPIKGVGALSFLGMQGSGKYIDLGRVKTRT